MADKVKEIIANYIGKDVNDINLEMDIIEDLNINSYDIMSIIGKFEQAFDIEVPDRDIRHFKKINDIVDYLEKKI